MHRLSPSPETLPEILARHARWHGERSALRAAGLRLTWRELNESANRLANGLLAAGVKPGNRVATLLSNSGPAVLAMLGVMKSGAVLVPLSTMLRPETLQLLAEDADIVALFADARNANAARVLRAALPAIAHRSYSVDDPVADLTPIGDWMNCQSAAEPRVAIDPSSEFNIIYSSGTTGIPKGIVHTHRARYAGSYARAVDARMDADSVTLLTTPLYSNGTLMMFLLPALVTNATIVVQERFDARQTLELIEAERCSHIFMVPTQLAALLAVPGQEDFDCTSLRTLFCSGAPLTADLRVALINRFGASFAELYGATEGFSLTLRAGEMCRKPNSVGRPTIGTDIRIIDDDGSELCPGAPGEVVASSPYLMSHYHNRPDATAEAIWRSPEGLTYYRSGDVGQIDNDGYLYLVGRKKDMIVSGGVNVFPGDIEAVLFGCEDVAEAAVVGIPHERWGETPVAYVVLANGSGQTADALLAWANGRLAKHQRLAEVVVLNSLPTNALGKILKRELREMFASGGQNA